MLQQIGVKGIFVRGREFLALYHDQNGIRYWDLPGGRLEFGEDIESAMIREAREELGCEAETIRLIDTWQTVKTEDWQIVGVFYLCRLMTDDIVLSDEHTGYQWISIDAYSEVFTARTFFERMHRWDWDRMLDDTVQFIYPLQWLDLAELVPNNLFLNGDKVERLRAVSVEDFEERIPPVIVSRIDGQYALIDGHSRAYCAFEKGLHQIRARMYPLEQVGGSPSLYRRIHELAISSGITDVGKLSDRFLYGQNHRDKWVAYCDSLLAELDGEE